jgi:hypothetical protein
LECGGVSIFDNSKAVYIAENFAPYKIGIFYKFQAEFDMLKAEFGDKLTNDIDEFNTTDKWIALQIVAGREGISLKKADYLVYLTIDFSATSYWQSRDRMTTIERLENEIFYIFAKGGIESRIYKSVLNKKTYTTKIFEDDEYNQRR